MPVTKRNSGRRDLDKWWLRIVSLLVAFYLGSLFSIQTVIQWFMGTTLKVAEWLGNIWDGLGISLTSFLSLLIIKIIVAKINAKRNKKSG